MTYPHLMPHSGLWDWAITAPCHNGNAIRCVTDNRILPWLQNYFSVNLSGYGMLYAVCTRPVATQSGRNVMDLRIKYGKCTIKTPS